MNAFDPSAHRLLDLSQIGRLIRSELGVLASLGVLVGLATVAVVATAFISAPTAPFVAAILLSPLYLAGVRISLRILTNDGGGIRALIHELPRSIRAGTWIGLLPALLVSVLISLLEYRSSLEAVPGWLTVIISVLLAIVGVLGFGLVLIYPIAVMTDQSRRHHWAAALSLVVRNPAVSLALVLGLTLLSGSVVYLGPMILILATGPFCLLNTAVVRGPVLGRPTPDPLV